MAILSSEARLRERATREEVGRGEGLEGQGEGEEPVERRKREEDSEVVVVALGRERVVRMALDEEKVCRSWEGVGTPAIDTGRAAERGGRGLLGKGSSRVGAMGIETVASGDDTNPFDSSVTTKGEDALILLLVAISTSSPSPTGKGTGFLLSFFSISLG